jgi:hypothetical protein
MKFVINGTEYEAASLERITGRHALDIAKQTKVGVATHAMRLDEMQRLTLDDEGKPVVLAEGSDVEVSGEVAIQSLFSSPPHLQALLVLIWMSRRMSGKEFNLTWDEVLDTTQILQVVPIDDEDEDEDEPEESEDPTQPSASETVVDGAAPSSTGTSKASTTSKRTSRRVS